MTEVKSGDTVRVHYTGKLDDGSQFDSSAGREPLEFTVGEGRIIRGVEDAMVGMTPGDTRTVSLEPEEGYGAHRPELVQEVEREQLPQDIEFFEGQQLQAQAPNAEPQVLTVRATSDATVTLDANHPLAGETLNFDLELVEIVKSA